LPREFVSGESYSYLGRHYRLKIERSADTAKPFASLRGAFLTVLLPGGDVAEDRRVLVKRAVVSWYRRHAERRLAERVSIYTKRAGVRPPPVFVREQEKRWGSCNRKGELRFNWRVIMAPVSLVDYVVAHEVCHLMVRDHSKRFWKLLRTILPDYEARRTRLRVAGVECHI
jgi:predicted metal-dependent hydrolase